MQSGKQYDIPPLRPSGASEKKKKKGCGVSLAEVSVWGGPEVPPHPMDPIAVAVPSLRLRRRTAKLVRILSLVLGVIWV